MMALIKNQAVDPTMALDEEKKKKCEEKRKKYKTTPV